MPLPLPLVGSSPAIQSLLDRLKAAARTPYPVLLIGESGTGKQAAAEFIHQHSPHPRQPFIEANVGCWNGNTMLHSLLFGHERGAFTGATQRHPGLFEQASGGTLFLDEIGELGLELQPLLLKVIDQGVIQPLGSTRSHKVNTRLVCATNRDLSTMVRNHQFRLDLWARISVLTLDVPSLVERIEDLPILWSEVCRKHCLDLPLPDDLEQRVQRGDFPDNLRGLERLAIQQSLWGSLMTSSMTSPSPMGRGGQRG